MKTTRFDGKLPADWRIVEGHREAERVDDRQVTHEEEEVIYSYEEERLDDRLSSLAAKVFVERKSLTTISSTSSPNRTRSGGWVTGLAFLVFFALTYKALTLAAISPSVASSLGEIIAAIGAGVGGARGVALLLRRRQEGNRR
jgi:hypothetical protein